MGLLIVPLHTLVLAAINDELKGNIDTQRSIQNLFNKTLMRSTTYQSKIYASLAFSVIQNVVQTLETLATNNF